MRIAELLPFRPPLVTAGLGALILASACGTDEESDDRPANDAQSESDVNIDESGTETDASGCEGATDRFWPDTAGCDPACHYLVEGWLIDETRECYGPSTELTTPLACLRDGLAGTAVACHRVPGLGDVITPNIHQAVGEEFEDCWMERQLVSWCVE